MDHRPPKIISFMSVGVWKDILTGGYASRALKTVSILADPD